MDVAVAAGILSDRSGTYRLERYVRHPEEAQIYLFEVCTAPEDAIHLDSIDCTLALADVFEKVVLDNQ